MKITIDIQPLLGKKSGVGFYISGLVEGLAQIDPKNQYQLSFFDFKNRQDLIYLPSSNFKRKKSFMPGRLASLLWKKSSIPSYNFFFGDSDIFHFPNFVLRPIRRGKAVVTIHDVSFLRFPEYTEPKNLKFLTAKIEETVFQSEKIIVDSNFTKSELLSFFKIDPSRVHPIHLGVDPRFQPSLSLDKNSKEILFVGNIEPRKNLPTLFKAFEIFCQKMNSSEYRLTLAGMRGWLYEETFRCLEKCTRKNQIRLLDYVSDADLVRLYQQAHVFVYPSFYEGFGLPPLEAMASATPVISAHSGSLPEVLGDAAQWINPNDAQDLARAIERLISDQEYRQELIKRGLRQVQNFKWEKAARETLHVYEQAYQS